MGISYIKNILLGENNMKTCIITGATSGIGKQTAILTSHLKQFDNIALIGRNQAALEKTKRDMDDNITISTWNLDLSKPESISGIVDDIFIRHSSIDCLLNIAGYTEPASIFSTTLENIKQTYAVNVFSPFVLIRESARYMKKTGGKILNIASTAGMSSRPGWISYASSKASIISMSKTLTDELAEYGIKIYCVSPGRCATNLRKKLAPNEDPTTIMQPDEVAKIICNLIDQNEECLDGQNIIIRKQI